MNKARPWLYFLFFILALAALSAFRETSPDVYGRYALVAAAIWIVGVIVLSAVKLSRLGNRTDSTEHEGFGMAALPLPRWKRWIYDERGPGKKNSN
jgi:amino acid permease